MAFKINIATKEGKTYKLEADSPGLNGKELGGTIQGIEVSPDLEGYEFKISGISDKSGFTGIESVQGIGLKKILLKVGEKGLKNKPKGESKKPVSTPKGLRMRKTVRGKVISDTISQINLIILKEGSKKLDEVFPDQAPKSAEEAKPEEGQEKAEEAPKEEEKSETPKEEAPKEEAKPEESEAHPNEEPKEAKPTEGNPEEEPKESEASKEEKAHPNEEPKQ